MFLTGVCLSTGGAWVAGGPCMVGGRVWQGGMHGRETCMVRGCAWQGACVAGGHVWQGACMAGGVPGMGACMARVPGGACVVCTPPGDTTRYGRSMRGRYTSYWNVFLLLYLLDTLILHIVCFGFLRGRRPPKMGTLTYYLATSFPKIASKRNTLVKIGDIRPCHPLDPSLFYVFFLIWIISKWRGIRVFPIFYLKLN